MCCFAGCPACQLSGFLLLLVAPRWDTQIIGIKVVFQLTLFCMYLDFENVWQPAMAWTGHCAHPTPRTLYEQAIDAQKV